MEDVDEVAGCCDEGRVLQEGQRGQQKKTVRDRVSRVDLAANRESMERQSTGALHPGDSRVELLWVGAEDRVEE